MKKEKFYRVKTDYLANKALAPPSNTSKDNDLLNSFNNGGILINITINKVYVFHKSLRELEEFFVKLIKRIDGNPVLTRIIFEILSRESIRLSCENSSCSIENSGKKRSKGSKEDGFEFDKQRNRVFSTDSCIREDITLLKDLDLLS